MCLIEEGLKCSVTAVVAQVVSEYDLGSYSAELSNVDDVQVDDSADMIGAGAKYVMQACFYCTSACSYPERFTAVSACLCVTLMPAADTLHLQATHHAALSENSWTPD